MVGAKRRPKTCLAKSTHPLLVASIFLLSTGIFWSMGLVDGGSPWVGNPSSAPPDPSIYQGATTKIPKQRVLYEPPKDIQFVPLTTEFIAMLSDGSYNRYATPNQYNGVPTNVSMSMYIEGISSFSAQTMDYHLDMYFYQEWNDTRLRHNGTGPMLIRDKTVFKKLWHPDIYFANARYATFQEITEDNFLVWVYPSGRVWYDCRISLVAICMMNLWKYPLDSQECSLRILSYAYPESVLKLRWSQDIDPPIDRNAEILMPDMRLVDIKTGRCNGTYATGTWSCMTAVFYVQREMMHHIIQTYVPTALIVVISWFNFWLDIDSAPARVSLSITTLLTIATQANAVKMALPEVSYMKAIDFWLGMCMTFVFGVMVEYTIAHYAKNQEIHRSLPPNLLVDSTLSTLFGASGNSTTGPVLPEQPMGTVIPKHFQKHRKSVPAIMSHSQSAYDHLSKRHASLRPDEPDLHTISIPEETAHLDWLHQDGNLSDEDELADIDYEESSFHTLYHDNHNSGHRLNNNNNIYATGLLHKHNSFTTNAAEARLRVPVETSTAPQESFGTTSPLHKTTLSTFGRPSVGRIKHQVVKRAMSMKSNVQAQYHLKGRAMAINIDQKSRIIFPAAFILVNFGYWGFYLVLN